MKTVAASGTGERRNSVDVVKQMREVYLERGQAQQQQQKQQRNSPSPLSHLHHQQLQQQEEEEERQLQFNEQATEEPVKDMQLTASEFAKVERYFGGGGGSSMDTGEASPTHVLRSTSPIAISRSGGGKASPLLSPIRASSQLAVATTAGIINDQDENNQRSSPISLTPPKSWTHRAMFPSRSPPETPGTLDVDNHASSVDELINWVGNLNGDELDNSGEL